MIPFKLIAALTVFSVAPAASTAATAMPPELSALVMKAQLDEQPSTWCRGNFQAGAPGAFAIAAPNLRGGGRYLVLGLQETPIELASFSAGADLACYSPDEARSEQEHRRVRNNSWWYHACAEFHRSLWFRGQYERRLLAVRASRTCFYQGRGMGHLAIMPYQPPHLTLRRMTSAQRLLICNHCGGRYLP